MKKLCILHALADGRLGGPGVRIVRVHSVLRRQLGEDFETVVACPELEPPDYFSRLGVRHVMVEWSKPQQERPFVTGVAWLARVLCVDLRKAIRVMRAVKPTVVHVNGAILMAPVIAGLVCRKGVVWHFNDVTVPKLYAWLSSMIVRVCGINPVAASEAVIKYYRLPINTRVIYPPAGFIRQGVKKPSGRRAVVGVMANLNPSKGVDEAIKAFAVLRDKGVNAHLVIAGRALKNKSWYYLELLEMVRGLKLEETVRFVGFVRDPGAWYGSIDVLAFFSRAEAAPLAVIEAMACGIPVVASDIPATREVLGGCGILCRRGNIKEMADAMERILSGSALRKEMILAGLSRARKTFHPEIIGHKYIELYSGMGNRCASR